MSLPGRGLAGRREAVWPAPCIAKPGGGATPRRMTRQRRPPPALSSQPKPPQDVVAQTSWCSKKILPRGFEPRTTACLSAAKRAVHRGNVPLDLYKHRVINQLDDGRRSSKFAAILLSSVGHRMTASSRGALSAHERPSRLTLAHGLRMRPPVLSRYAAPAWKEAHARSSVCDPAASSRRCLVLRRSGRLS